MVGKVSAWWERAEIARRRRIDREARSAWSSENSPWDWDAIPYNRVAVLNKTAQLIGAQSYLEIGCADDVSFRAVTCDHKVGVDPVSGGTHRMTSDTFFADNEESFDLIFIDGLHQYVQALTDVENALRVLNKGAVIVMHDCLPTSYAEQTIPRQQGNWTGDVWKVIMELKSRNDVDVRVVAVDHGCGIVVPRERTDEPDLPHGDAQDMSYGVFVEHWHEFGILDYGELAAYLQAYVPGTSGKS